MPPLELFNCPFLGARCPGGLFVPPLMGGMVLETSKRTKDRKSPLGAYFPHPFVLSVALEAPP